MWKTNPLGPSILGTIPESSPESFLKGRFPNLFSRGDSRIFSDLIMAQGGAPKVAMALGLASFSRLSGRDFRIEKTMPSTAGKIRPELALISPSRPDLGEQPLSGPLAVGVLYF